MVGGAIPQAVVLSCFGKLAEQGAEEVAFFHGSCFKFLEVCPAVSMILKCKPNKSSSPQIAFGPSTGRK